jgi:hypothetical protein
MKSTQTRDSQSNSSNQLVGCQLLVQFNYKLLILIDEKIWLFFKFFLLKQNSQFFDIEI